MYEGGPAIGASVAPHLIYREVGSGADWDLPRLLDLLDRAQRREFEVVITLATSRLARDVGKLAVLQRTLKRSGVTIQYVHHRSTTRQPASSPRRCWRRSTSTSARTAPPIRPRQAGQDRAELVMGMARPPTATVPCGREGRTVALGDRPATGACPADLSRSGLSAPQQDRAQLDAEGSSRRPGLAVGREDDARHDRQPRLSRAFCLRASAGRADSRPGWAPARGLHARDESEWQYVDCPPLVTEAERDAVLTGLAEAPALACRSAATLRITRTACGRCSRVACAAADSR